MRLKHVDSFRKVSFYSIVINQDEDDIEQATSLFEDFVQRMGSKYPKKLSHILAWLQEIGNKYGATQQYFRNEQFRGEAMGLPPIGIDRQPPYIEDGKNVPNNLRLYCYVLNESVVILFSGGIKTKDKAQDCPNVKPAFMDANRYGLLIDKAIQEGEIRWRRDGKDITFNNDLIIYF